MDKNSAIERLLKYISTDKLVNEVNHLNLEKTHILKIEEYKCLVRELTWKEALEIENLSYKSKDKKLFLSSENEKRNIIKKILLSIIDKEEQEITFTFESLEFYFIENIWSEYQKFLHLSSDEINFIYNSTKNYFNSSTKEFYPVHPLIIEVDYMLKGIVTYSKAEFENLSIREFEAIQLIMAAVNER